MKKRYLFLAVLALAVLAVLAYEAWQYDDDTTTFDVYDTAFAVQDTASIDKIYIAYKTGDDMLFARDENRDWVINDKYHVTHHRMDLLLTAIHGIKLKRPINESEREWVVKDLASKGIKVEIYRQGELFKVLWIGPSTADDLGTYALIEGSEHPAVTHIPGFNGYLTARFLIQEDGWRDKRLTYTNSETLQKLSIQYDKESYEDLVITRNDERKLEIEGNPAIESSKIEQYIDKFIPFTQDYFYEANDIRDSLLKQTPNVIVEVVDQEPKNSITLHLYEGLGDAHPTILFSSPDKELVQISNTILEKILAEPKDFIESK